MSYVGFSTGCLYRTPLDVHRRIDLYASLGSDVIELGFATPAELFDFGLTEKDIENLKNYKHVSIHAPWKDVTYSKNMESEIVVGKIREMCEKTPIDGIVLHPNVVEDFAYVENTGLSFLIENMDSRKKHWLYPSHFETLINNHGFGFVFDAQHAYEHDNKMTMGKELLSAMGSRLKHMHISGCGRHEIHLPVHAAENVEAITKILEMKIDVPKILEGVISANSVQSTALKELDFVRKYEKIQ